MGILKAENNVAYTSHNAIKIYIIKQEAYENKVRFEQDYASLLGNATNPNKFLNINNAAISYVDRDIKLVRLLDYDRQNTSLYTTCKINNSPDRPRFKVDGEEPKQFYFLTSLFQLRNCPLLDLSKLAYVFQMDGQSEGGLANVVSFNTNFNVNSQSTAEIVLNNKDFKYNFKFFDDKQKYQYHLKSYFDTNDIIIIRIQKKNTRETSLLNSFKIQQIDYWRDLYIEDENDQFSTVFTGYINDINDSFSFSNGQQTVTLNCTGPSKKLTWSRFLSNKAAASKDSLSAILPISAYVNPQTFNEQNKASIENNEVVSNLIVRTYSGVLNIPEIKDAYETFVKAFDTNNNIKTSNEIKELEKKIQNLDAKKDIEKLKKANAQLSQRKSELQDTIKTARNNYNKLVNKYMNQFVDGDDKSGWIGIKGNRFAYGGDFGEPPYVFKIEGTDQPAYQWTFANYSSLFKSDFSTVYQFIKGIADNLQFNFYDDPYGTIHFSIPDMSLCHLHNGKHPNNLNQLISFSESQNTESIANIQYCEAKYTYDLPLDIINTVAKDYRSIQKYGEKMMQPFSMVGLTEPAAIRYAAKMRMAKYNRKALSNIKVTLNGEPDLKLDKYAYIKSLRKLFYIESYSHSYNAGGQFTTSLIGTYTREILALMDVQSKNKSKFDSKLTLNTNMLSSLTKINEINNLANNIDKTLGLQQQLRNAITIDDIMKILNTIEFPSHDILAQKVYQIYINNWSYPENDENLKFDIGAMYNADNLRQCILDGFFWALPFDVDPYAMAQQIQADEIAKKQQLSKTKKVKTNSVNNIDIQNVEQLNGLLKKQAKESINRAVNEYNTIKSGGSVIKAKEESSIPYTELDNGVRIYDYSKIRKSMSIGVNFDMSKIDIRPGKMLDVGVQSLLNGDKE